MLCVWGLLHIDVVCANSPVTNLPMEDLQKFAQFVDEGELCAVAPTYDQLTRLVQEK